MGYGMHFPVNRLGGPKKVCVMREYGLSGLCVMRESTVAKIPRQGQPSQGHRVKGVSALECRTRGWVGRLATG